MGSFNSAPKIYNTDSQDDHLRFPKGLTASEFLEYISKLRKNYSPLLKRQFMRSCNKSQPTLNGVVNCMKHLTLNSTAAGTSTRVCLRLLQWNILSQTLGQYNDGFVRCPDEALTWDHRKFLIVQEILEHNPDIICLQEVDHYKFLQNALGSQNYEGVFYPKPDSPCLYIEKNNGPDGCAIFYKSDVFKLKKLETHILKVWHVQSNQVAIIANLEILAIGKEICVCTTHLKARQETLLSKLRNEQGKELLRLLQNCAGKRPIVLCGDFNAEPTEPVYSTILSCKEFNLSSAYADMRYSDGLNTEMDTTINETKVDDMIKREPLYTTWKIRADGEVCHTIDYVFYTRDKLKVTNCLDFPTGDQIGKDRTPNYQYPSDHFSLVCDFELEDDSNSKVEEEKSAFNT